MSEQNLTTESTEKSREKQREEVFTEELNALANTAYRTFRKFYECDDGIDNQMLYLVGELQELLDAVSENKDVNWCDCQDYEDLRAGYPVIKDTIQDELADIMIMVLCIFCYYGGTLSKFDILWHVKNKLEYNISRGYGGEHAEARV